MISLEEGAHQYVEAYFNSFIKNYVSKEVLMRAHGHISSFWYLTKRITFVTLSNVFFSGSYGMVLSINWNRLASSASSESSMLEGLQKSLYQ